MTTDGATLDDLRRELYAGPRATFVQRRKELAAATRRSGDRDGATLIGQMRKPTAAAHVVNLLALADDASVQELIELGVRIRAAMAAGDNVEMRALLQGRAAAVAKALAAARRVALANEETLSDPTVDQIVQTLRAAMASDEAAATIRDGTLCDALDGYGVGDLTIAAPPRAPSPTRDRGTTAPPTGNAAVDRAAQQAAARAAQARITAAAADLRRVERERAAAVKRRDGVERERDRLVAHLAQVEQDLAAAQADVDDLEAQHSDAADRLDAARRQS